MCCILFVVLCIVCFVSQYCVVQTIKCKKMFQRKLYNNYVFCIVLFVVLCIVCCVSQYCVVPTIKCKFFQQNLIFFHKNIKILNVFLSVVSFSMSACSVRLMWPSLWWSCCVFSAVMPSFRWPDWAVVPPAVGAMGMYATNHNSIIYQPIFTIFAAKNSAISKL